MIFPTAALLCGCGEMVKPEYRNSVAGGVVLAGLFAYAVKESPATTIPPSTSSTSTSSTTTTTLGELGPGGPSNGIGGTAASWTLQAIGPYSSREGHACLVFQSKLWLIAGYNGSGYLNDCWSSSDGVNWTETTPEAAFSPRYSQAAAVFNDGVSEKLWLIGGVAGATYNNEIWNSTDGVNWSLAGTTPFSSRESAVCLVFHGKLWVIGGLAVGDDNYKNDVWSSSDGVNWIQETAAAGFSPRYRHAGAVFNNLLWITGGFNGSQTLNDTWYSADGVNWTLAAGTFPSREGQALVANAGALWLIGGQYRNTIYNDVWTSNDGAAWTLVSDNTLFSPRYHLVGQSFLGKLWITGGTDSVNYRSGVWSTL